MTYHIRGWLAVCLLTMVSGLAAQEWTRFRGPNGAGISSATTIPTQWAESDYKWQVALSGVGHSSPVLWGRRIFLTSGDEESGRRIVLCLDAAEQGKTLWTREFPAKHHGKHKLNSFASATPVVDERRVYSCWATPEEFIVLALDHDGREVWRHDLGPFKSGHGFGVSPIVHGDLLIVPNEQESGSLIAAFERDTGKLRWKAERDSKTTWSTPCVRQRNGGAELICTTWTSGITALDPATGQTNWQANVFEKSHIESTIGSPILAGDLVLGMSGWLGVRKEIIAVRPPSKPGDSPEKVYTLDRAVPLCTTPLVKDDRLYLWADEGIVSCADARTGKVHWTQRVGGTYYASPVWIDGRLYNVSADGEVVVLAAEEKFASLARNKLGDFSHSTPAVADGVLYLRTFSRLYAIGK